MLIALKNPAHHRFALQSCLGNAREIADGGRGCLPGEALAKSGAEPQAVFQRNLMLRADPGAWNGTLNKEAAKGRFTFRSVGLLE
jgi:hypothetical protein